MNVITKGKMYTFNQSDRINRLTGNVIRLSKIDTAMILIHYDLCKNVKWINDKWEADGYYIMECCNNSRFNYLYVDNDLCYYNIIPPLGKAEPNH